MKLLLYSLFFIGISYGLLPAQLKNGCECTHPANPSGISSCQSAGGSIPQGDVTQSEGNATKE